jgi:HlyD family secretion protein
MAAGSKKRRPAWLLWVGGLVVVGGIVAWRGAASRNSGSALPVGLETAKVEKGTQQQKIVATGVVASQIGSQVKIGSQITGTIRALPADVGTHVTAGQVVAELDLPDLKAQVDEQRQSVAVAEASLMQTESRLKQAAEAAGYNSEQTAAQIAQAEAAYRAAHAKVESSDAAARFQPIQTTTDIERADAALASARSAQKQVEQTIKQQNQQAQANVDDAQAAVENTQRTFLLQQKLLTKGFIAQNVVDQSESAYKQAVARLNNMRATQEITREKTVADLQSTQAQVAQAQASLKAAQAGKYQVNVREADLRSAQETERQAQATLTLQKANHRGDKIKEMAVAEARSAVVQARANVQQTRSRLHYQLDQLAKTVIRSPISGTVLSITAQQGETVAAGFSAPTLITVADLSRLEVRAYVDETDIGHMRLNLPAEVRVEAFPGKIFKGRVTKIASASTVKDNVITYETTVAVENAGGLLRPDMTTTVSLILGEYPNVLLVPSEAVHQETNRSFVYLFRPIKQGLERAELRVIQTGFDDGSHTEVKKGLKEGDSVIVAGLSKLGVKAPDSQGGGR